jgi:putative ABC transport system permease protein
VNVAAIVQGYLGLSAYMDLVALNKLLGDESLISGANVAIDPAQQDRLFAVLKETPSAGHISLQSAALSQFRVTMAQNIFMMIGVLVGLAAMIAFGVVYNFSRISLSEQGREMASLRVLGFRRGEVSGLILAEIAAVVLLAQPLGWLIGTVVALGMVEGYSSEIYRMPFVLGPDVFAYSSLVVIVAALLSGLVIRRRVDRLDMIAVLKTRE